MNLTPFQHALLKQLVDEKKYYLYGASEVRAARALQAKGLVVLEDNGVMGSIGGRVDGERWSCEPTEAGRAALDVKDEK